MITNCGIVYYRLWCMSSNKFTFPSKIYYLYAIVWCSNIKLFDYGSGKIF